MEKETNMEKIYTTKQVANNLGLSTESVRAMLRKGRIKGAKVSQDWTVRESDLQDFMASQKSFSSHKKGKNEPVAECDKTGDTVERYKSQGVFSNIKVCDVLNFVKENTTNHDDFPYRIEITDNVDFHKEFTMTERLAYARKLTEIESKKAKKRMIQAHASLAVDESSTGSGKTRDKVAKAVGDIFQRITNLFYMILT